MSGSQQQLSDRQIQELRDAFDLFDRDGSGAISSTELQQVLVALNLQPTASLLESIMHEMDTDGNGSVEFDEFARVMANVYQRQFTNEEMRRAFQCFDTDNSGYITVNELKEVLRRLNHHVDDDEIREVIRNVDTDHDGKISFEEFVHIIQDS